MRRERQRAEGLAAEVRSGREASWRPGLQRGWTRPSARWTRLPLLLHADHDVQVGEAAQQRVGPRVAARRDGHVQDADRARAVARRELAERRGAPPSPGRAAGAVSGRFAKSRR